MGSRQKVSLWSDTAIVAILRHSAVVFILVALFTAIGAVLRSLEQNFPQMTTATRFLSALDVYLIIVVFASYSLYVTAVLVIRFLRAIRYELSGVSDAKAVRAHSPTLDHVSAIRRTASEPSDMSASGTPVSPTLIFDLALLFAAVIGELVLSFFVHQAVVVGLVTIIVALVSAYGVTMIAIRRTEQHK